MKHRSTTRTLALATLLAALAAGCTNIPDRPESGIGLDRGTQRVLLACQKTVNRQSAKFVAAGLKGLGRCVESAVALRMEEDALAGSQTGETAARRAALVERCEADFARLGKASVKLIGAIQKACEPVEDALLQSAAFGDPLRFRAFNAAVDALGHDELIVGNARELGGLVCGVGVQAVGGMLFVQAPRHADAIRTLLGVFPSGFEAQLRTFLDPRCVDVDE
ncbi:MAG: hypothetical protein AB1689_00930 [Thermodesulfobacteriota bacterium]